MKQQFVIIKVAVLVIVASVALATGQGKDRTANSKPGGREAKAVAAIRSVLDAQAEGWNRGDVDAYMDGYMRSPETILVSGDQVTRGWQVVLDRYKKSYNSREKMGRLTFTEIEINLLSKDAATALGRWQLTRATDTPHGRFTLIFRRTPQGWRIVHDHTSTAE
jgi:beta-aspartyl-peptidase (threonine type)